MDEAAPSSIRSDRKSRATAACRAIAAAGGGAKLASLLGVTRFAVQQWKTAGIPPARAHAVSRITSIPAHDLRPDVFDPAHSPAIQPAHSDLHVRAQPKAPPA